MGLGGIGKFIFGDPGGLTKEQQALLDRELAALDPNDLAGITAYAQRRVEPTFGRARKRVAQKYQGADAPIISGGRTLEELDLAGEEAGSIADIVEAERTQRRTLRQQLLGHKLRPKEPTGGLFGGLARGAGAFLGAGGLDLFKKSKPSGGYV